MTDINRELAEDAAEDYSDDPETRECFVIGWLHSCNGCMLPEDWHDTYFEIGYFAARDAPD